MSREDEYTPELAERICNLIAVTPQGLKRICKAHDDLPDSVTIYSWLSKYPEFLSQYLAAKERQAIVYSDEVIDYVWNVDERSEAIAKANCIVNASKWHLSKLAPKTFGDKKEVKQDVHVHEHEEKLKDLE